MNESTSHALQYVVFRDNVCSSHFIETVTWWTRGWNSDSPVDTLITAELVQVNYLGKKKFRVRDI